MTPDVLLPQLHSDVDKGDGKVKYVLSGEGATSIFTIDENTGDIHATKRLDREAQAYYTLQAQAVDRLTNLPVEPRSEFVVKVQDINDNEPKFVDGPYLAGVPEMSPLGEFSIRSPHRFLFCSPSAQRLHVITFGPESEPLTGIGCYRCGASPRSASPTR